MSQTTTIYHNPNCSKSKATLEILTKKKESLDVINYLDTPPDNEALESILTMLGLAPRELMRSWEAIYTELNLADESLSRSDLITAMLENPILIERPIVIKNGKATIGRPPESVIDIL
ncbi:MAG: arsenate reductase (glutaredoxin) [Cocleimonas sp.]|nr:arsenate reductase (glutaredoxin) [Cocleimonas sp.]